MIKTFKLFVILPPVFFFLISVPSTHASVTCPSAGAIPSVTSGYAPLAVFFDATGSTDSNSSIPFQEDLFTWNFDNPSPEIWKFSGQPKNIAYGGVAAHVFETPGTYSPTLTIKNIAGETCSVTLPAITVTDPANTMTTYCFSITSDFTGCPAGATQVTQSNFNTIMSTYLATNRRLLLHRGQTFTSTTGVTTAVGPWMLASFGSGNKPIISSSNSTTYNSLISLSSRSNIVLQDLDLRGVPGPSGAGNNFCGISNLLLRVDVQGFTYNATCDGDGVGWPGYHHVTWVDGIWTNFTQYNAYLSGTEFAIMGMDFGLHIGPPGGFGHNVRAHVLQKSVLQHNKFEPQNNNTFIHQLKWPSGDFNGSSHFSDRKSSEFSIFSDNVVYSGSGTASSWVLSIEPTNAERDERHNDIVIERNYITASTGGYGTSIETRLLLFSGTNSTIRNNIFDSGTHAINYGCLWIGRRGIEPLPGNNRVYNNTCIYRGSRVGFEAFTSTSAGGSVFQNNLFYATSPSPVFGGADTIDHNLTVTGANPFVNSSYSTPTDYKIQTPNANIVGAGIAVPVFNDFGAVLRSSVWDLGAWAVSGGTPPPDTTAPSIPTGLSSNAVSSSQINLSWNASTDNVGVTGYRVYREGTLLTTLLNVTTYSDIGLTAGTPYSYTVSAIDLAGNASGQSALTSATTQGASTLPNILWTDNIQVGSSPWGFSGISTQHPIGPEVSPSDANGVNFSRVANPLVGGGYAIRQYATFDQGGSRSQAGIWSFRNTAFNDQAKSAEGIYVAQEWYFPQVLTTGGDGVPWLNLWDWHSTDAGGANRWHTCPGLMLFEDGSMRVRWEWGCLNTTNPTSSLSTIPLPVGRWFDIEMYYKWTSGVTTLYLWIDGALALQESGVQTKAPSHVNVEVYPLKFYGSQNGGAPWVPTPSIKYGRNVRISDRRIWQGTPSSGGSISSLTLTTPTLDINNLSSVGRSFYVSFYNPGSTTTLSTSIVTGTANTITFTPTNLSSGTYDVRVKRDGSLYRKKANLLLSNGTSLNTFSFLISGDLNGDNAINALDWSMMSPDWFLTNKPSDINGDGITNALDFTWLNRNWFLTGE